MRNLVLLFAICISGIICSCNSSQPSAQKTKQITPVSSDTFTGKPFRGKVFSDRHDGLSPTFLLVIKECPVYSDFSLQGKIIKKLSLGDSISSNENILSYSPQYSSFHIRKLGRDTFSGYIFYENVALATSFPLDKSGFKQYIALHFTANADSNGNADIPAEALAISNGKILSRCAFKANNELGIVAVADKAGFAPPVSLLLARCGEETEDAPNTEFLFSWDGNKLDTICENMTNVDLGENTYFGIYYDYIFPSDSGGQPNKLFTVRYDDEENDDTHKKIRYGSSTDIYTWQNGKFIQTEQGKRIKLIHGIEPPDTL